MCCRRGEQYAKGWGVESHDRGNPGEGLKPQETQGTIVMEGRVGMGFHRKLHVPQHVHLPTSSQSGALLAHSPQPLQPEATCHLPQTSSPISGNMPTTLWEPHPPAGSHPLVRHALGTPVHLQEAPCQHATLWAPPPACGNTPIGPVWTVPNYSLASPNLQKKKNKQDEEAQKHSQLKEQENSPEAVNNETDLCNLTMSSKGK